MKQSIILAVLWLTQLVAGPFLLVPYLHNQLVPLIYYVLSQSFIGWLFGSLTAKLILEHRSK